MSTDPAVVAFFRSFDEALRRDKSRQLREQAATGEDAHGGTAELPPSSGAG